MTDKMRRKTGGRKKGSRNKKTLRLMEEARAAVRGEGEMPVEFMLKVMRSKKGRYTQAERMDAAKAVAPYMHPRLSSVDQRVQMDSEDPLAKLLREIGEEGRRIDDKPAGNGHDSE